MSQCKLNIEDTPKNGCGDGQKNLSAHKRVPTPSSRKFNARGPPMEEDIKLKLKTALFDLQTKSQKKLTKARSVAEIQPTKCKIKRRSITTNDSVVTLHATPRPVKKTPAVVYCQRNVAVCRLYERLLLKAWRRTRTRLLTLVDSSRRQQEQVSQLEMQVEVLRNLSKSEHQKTDEVSLECKKLQNYVDALELENKNFTEKMLMLKNENEILLNEKHRLSEDNSILKTKITNEENTKNTILLQINNLEDCIKGNEEELKVINASYALKLQEYEDILRLYELESNLNAELKQELHEYKQQNGILERNIDNLHNELLECNLENLELSENNGNLTYNMEELTCELEKAKKMEWWKCTKEFAILSWNVLDNAAHIMLPAYIN